MIIAVHRFYLLIQLPIQSFGSLIQRFNEEVEHIMNQSPEKPVGVPLPQCCQALTSTDPIFRKLRSMRRRPYARFAMRCISIPIGVFWYSHCCGSDWQGLDWLCVTTYSVCPACSRSSIRGIHPQHTLRNAQCAGRPSSLSQGQRKSSMCLLQSFVQSRGCHHSLWIHPLWIHFTSIQSERVRDW
jgi:hypothetical protein